MAKGYGNLNFRNSYNTVASHEYENLSRLTKGDHLFCFCVCFFKHSLYSMLFMTSVFFLCSMIGVVEKSNHQALLTVPLFHAGLVSGFQAPK